MKKKINMIPLNMQENSSIKVIKGTTPILLSAPHVHSHRRPSLTMSYKLGEPYTDRIVEEICNKTGAWAVIQSEETPFDPNYHKIKDNPYKSLVGDIIKEEKIKRFVDFHGLSDEHEYDLGVYYPSKFFKSIVLANDIANAVDKGQLRGLNVCIFRFRDDLQETLGEFVASKLRIPSVQLEIVKYIRQDEKLRKEFIENLSSFLLV